MKSNLSLRYGTHGPCLRTVHGVGLPGMLWDFRFTRIRISRASREKEIWCANLSGIRSPKHDGLIRRVFAANGITKLARFDLWRRRVVIKNVVKTTWMKNGIVRRPIPKAISVSYFHDFKWDILLVIITTCLRQLNVIGDIFAY